MAAEVLLGIVMPRLVSNPNLLGIPTLQWAIKQVMNSWEDVWLHEWCVFVDDGVCVGGVDLSCAQHNQG